jgi:hypothetical protein
MKIYEVIFWASEGDQPEKDTIYLVRAPDFRTAVSEVSNNSSPSHHGGKRFPLAHVVYEVGTDLSLNQEDYPKVLRGPYFESAYNRGWRAWHRKTEGSDYTNDWQEEGRDGVHG